MTRAFLALALMCCRPSSPQVVATNPVAAPRVDASASTAAPSVRGDASDIEAHPCGEGLAVRNGKCDWYEPPESPRRPPEDPTRRRDERNAFDRRAVAASLAAVPIAHCVVGRDVSGHATITFTSSGKVSAVDVDSAEPTELEVRACVARAYAQVVVPPFEGAPVRVGKSFSLR